MVEIKGTTILAVKDESGVAIGGDGQVTLGQAISIKHKAKKSKKIV